MNAKQPFVANQAHVDEAAIAPLPNSRKVYIEGSRPDIQVPMREISQSDTPTGMGGEKNPPIYVYDCSGPYTDPCAKIDIRAGLPALRQQWIEERGDTEVLNDLTSDFGRERAGDKALDELRFPGLHRKPRRAKAGANVSQMHYARKGIITPEMEFVALREGCDVELVRSEVAAGRDLLDVGREERQIDEDERDEQRERRADTVLGVKPQQFIVEERARAARRGQPVARLAEQAHRLAPRVEAHDPVGVAQPLRFGDRGQRRRCPPGRSCGSPDTGWGRGRSSSSSIRRRAKSCSTPTKSWPSASASASTSPYRNFGTPR